MPHFFSLARRPGRLAFRFAFYLLCSLTLAPTFAITAHADTYTLYGPETFSRSFGPPQHETRTFTAPQTGSDYQLRVQNGPERGLDYVLCRLHKLFKMRSESCTKPVRKGRILVNGEEIVSAAELRRAGGRLIEKIVALEENNSLLVEIKGAPGSSFTVEVLGFDETPPQIQATVVPAANTNGWHNSDVTVTFTCSDADSGIQSCSDSVAVSEEGADQIATGTAVDNAGNTASTEVTINLDKTAPLVSIVEPADGAQIENLRPEILLALSDNLALDTASVQLLVNGATAGCTVEGGSAVCLPQSDLLPGEVTLAASVIDLAGNSASAESGFMVADNSGGNPGDLPPDPEKVATPIDTTGTSNLKSTTEFLYTGDNPIQTGVDPETIEERRASVIRGTVRDKENNPLPGVTITIKDHPEFGQTLSREDGAFDMAVNGGGYLVIDYQKEGFLPAQRRVKAPWNDYALAEDPVLIPLDSQVTAIDLTDGSQPFQVHRGSLQTDEDGSRQATILFPAGTTATMTLPGGSVTSIDQLNVRATEYTVGENGPETMPGPLPPTSGYTYAVELGVDQAIAAGATRVDFSQPLPVYVDNFLEFPAGTTVPAGWYDREKAAWIPSDNGVVVEIIGIVDGLAELDVDGSGVAADAVALGELGITDAERQQLAQLYEMGKSLWRTPITHFTPWDCNWPYGPPMDAERPQPPEPETDEPEPEPECEGGSIIECQGQVLRERIPVVGTPFTLNYRSDRVPGRTAYADIQLTGETIPSSLEEVVLEISIAGRDFSYSFEPQADLSYRFVWDGLDSYGRKLVGSHTANIQIGYVYEALYYKPDEFGRAFARAGSGPITRGGNSVSARRSITLWRLMQKALQVMVPRVGEFGAWSLSPYHQYAPNRHALLLGGGTIVNQKALGNIIDTEVGNGEYGFSGDGGPAKEAKLRAPKVAFGPDGSIYIADISSHRVRHVNSDGVISTIAGKGYGAYLGDGGPASDAYLNEPADVAYSSDGNLYIADASNNRIRRIDPNGIITTVAGTGLSGFSGDGGLAVNAKLNRPTGVAVSPDGSLYIAEQWNHRIRRIDPEGVITTVAGSGNYGGFSGDGGLATDAELKEPFDVTYGHDGNLYIADYGNSRIRRVSQNGIITTVAGSSREFGGDIGDGGKATDAIVAWPRDVDLGADGNIYIADSSNNRLRQVSSDGVITTVAGNGSSEFSGDKGPATDAGLFPFGIAYGPEGNLYIAANSRIRYVGVRRDVSFGETLFASNDGGRLFYFDATGRHMKTSDTATGAMIYQFHYDIKNLLIRIEDADGNATIIERDSSGNPLAIVAPDGQRTTLALDLNGYLAGVTNPAGESYTMAYTEDGLLTRFTDPNQHSSTMTYDDAGYLLTDINASGGGWTLEKGSLNPGQEYRMTSAEGRTTRYQVIPESVGGRSRVNIHSDGTEATTLFGTGGDVITIAPDGTETYRKRGPDPRFSMGAPVPENVTVTTPSGLEQVTTTSRSVELEDKADLLSHTALGQTVSVNGRTTTSSYDAASRTWQSTTHEGRQSTTVLNEKGRPVSQQSGGLAPLGFSYDSRGRLIASTAGTGAGQRTVGYSYGSDGFLSSITDTLQRTTSFNYDLAGRVTRQTYHDGRSVGYQYDPAGNLAAITPPGGEAHIFNYTKVNLEDGYTPPDLDGMETATSYQYNKDKQLTGVERPDGRTIAYGYDDGGRLTSRTIARGSYGYAYDENTGQLSSITAPGGGTLNYTYDGFLPLSETWGGSIAGSVSWKYDNNFWLTEQCVNTDNCISFGYDQDGLLTQAGELSQTRNAQSGLLENSELGNTATEYGYNSFGELLSAETEVSDSTLASFGYQRDSLGRIGSKTETLNGSLVAESYEYDTVGRLKSATRDGETTSWQYDGNGNRTHENGQQIATYDEQDRLLTYKGVSYSYTANGELKSKTESGATTGYSYDEFGNLIGANLPGDVQIEYLIDGRDRRFGKKVNGQLVQGFIYGDQLNPVAELDGSGNIVARFVYGEKANVPTYIVKGGTTYRIISDHLGSPRLIVNASTGEIAQYMDYDAWGNVSADTNPGFQPFGFAGGIYDQHIKLTRFGVRDYDAKTGRWMAKDPLRFVGGDSNLYAYVANNPINWIDPYGLWCIGPHATAAIAGGLGGAVTGALLGANPATIAAGAALGAASAYASSKLGGDASANGGAGAIAGAITGGKSGFIGGAVGGIIGASSGSNAAGGALGGFVGGVFSQTKQLHGNAWTGSVSQNMLKGGWAGLIGGLVQDITLKVLTDLQDCEDEEACQR